MLEVGLRREPESNECTSPARNAPTFTYNASSIFILQSTLYSVHDAINTFFKDSLISLQYVMREIFLGPASLLEIPARVLATNYETSGILAEYSVGTVIICYCHMLRAVF